MATKRIAKEAAKLNIKKLIFLSTVKYMEKTFPNNPFNNKTKFVQKIILKSKLKQKMF